MNVQRSKTVNSVELMPNIPSPFQMAATLVPLARYDSRFARAIGKWMLNAANNARLFYADFYEVKHQKNPLLQASKAGWDRGAVWNPAVIVENNKFQRLSILASKGFR